MGYQQGYHQVTIGEWLTAKEELRKALQDTKTAFVRTGYWLRKIEDGKLYEQDGRGFHSVAEFAKAEYNISPSTCSRLMTINQLYSEGGYSRELAAPYKGFSFGLLVEMKDLSEAGRAMVTPDTPRAEIREIRRFEKDEKREPEPEPVAGNAAIRKFLEMATERERADVAAALTKEDARKALYEAVAPSGSRVFRAGIHLINFTEGAVKIRTFGKGEETASWEEFAGEAEAFLAEMAARNPTEENGQAAVCEAAAADETTAADESETAVEQATESEPAAAYESEAEPGSAAVAESEAADEQTEGGEPKTESEPAAVYETAESEQAAADDTAVEEERAAADGMHVEDKQVAVDEAAKDGHGGRDEEGHGATDGWEAQERTRTLPQKNRDGSACGNKENAIAPAQFEGRETLPDKEAEGNAEPDYGDGATVLLAAADLERAAKLLRARKWTETLEVLERVRSFAKKKSEEKGEENAGE